MADNLAVTAGLGTTIAADDIGAGVLAQRVKQVWGPDGTGNDVDVASGKSLPIQVRSATGLIPLGEPTDAKSTATDTTSVTGISIWKQVSASAQLIATAVGAALSRGSGAIDAGILRVALATDSPGVAILGQTTKSASAPVTLASDQALGFALTCTTSITRPADTTAYAANDCFSDSTSAPTSGGYTLTGAGRISGGSGIITDILIVSSADPATTLQGELWIFDSAATNVNDNAAFALSDGDALLLVGVVPFTLATTVAGSGTNSYASLQGLNLGFTCVGTANLRYLVKVKAAYTPISAEVLTVRAKIVQTN